MKSIAESDVSFSSDQLQELAGTVAQDVPGVNQVDNNLVVKDSDWARVFQLIP